MATIIVPALVFVDEDDDDDGCPVFASSNESTDDVTVSGSTGENRLRFRNPRTRTHSHTHADTQARTHKRTHTHTHLAGRRAREKPSSFRAFQGILLGLMTVALVATTTFPQWSGSDHNRQHLFRGLLRFASNFLDVLFSLHSLRWWWWEGKRERRSENLPFFS